MLELLTDMGNLAVITLMELLAACLLIGLFSWLYGRKKTEIDIRSNNALGIPASALLGILLPCGPMGALPVIAVMAAAGISHTWILALFTSNFLFHLALPLKEIGFTWGANVARMALSVIIGASAGFLLKIFKVNERSIINPKALAVLDNGSSFPFHVVKLFKSCLGAFGLYLLLGTAANSLFHRFLFYDFLKSLYASPVGEFAISTFMGLDISNVFFGVAGQMINRLMDMTAICASVFLFRMKGLILFLSFYLAWVAVLVIPVFL